jgi:hypothetical protein
MLAAIRPAPRVWASIAALAAPLLAAKAADAQSGYYASIAYSQSTGRIGFSARQARTRQSADQLAIRMCAAPDAKVFMWARDQWVAVAIVENAVGNAGFGRGYSSEDAQQKALAECAKRAGGRAYRVALCVHSSGQRERDLKSVDAKPIKSRTGVFAALAFSPSTGKIGQTVGKAKTIEEAQKLALEDCDAPDAKAFMWGDLWIAVAVGVDRPGVAGFAPGATREAAEKAALEQAMKFAKGGAVKLERAIYSTGEENPAVLPVSAEEPAQPSAPRQLRSPSRRPSSGARRSR